MIITENNQWLIVVLENAEEIIKKCKVAKEKYLPLLKSFSKELKKNLELDIFGEEEEILTLARLTETAKKYLVKGSDEVVVLKQQEAEGILIYLSYAKNRELLPRGENKYIIIKAKELSDDVKELFNESDLIILN